MTIHFYIHKFDLDHLNKLINNQLLDEGEEYNIEVYMLNANGMLQNNYFLVGINYDDYMRIEDFLDFK